MREESRAHKQWCEGVRRLGHHVHGTTSPPDSTKAREHFARALELDPGLVDAHLGMILVGENFHDHVMAAMARPERWGEARERTRIGLETRFSVDGIFTQRLATGQELYLAGAAVQIRQGHLAHAHSILTACPQDGGMFDALRAHLYSSADRHTDVLIHAGRVSGDNIHYYSSAMVYAARASLSLHLIDESIRRTAWLLDHGSLADAYFRYVRVLHAYAHRHAGHEAVAIQQFQRVFAEDPTFDGIRAGLEGAQWPLHDPATVSRRKDPWDPGSVRAAPTPPPVDPAQAVAAIVDELRAMPGMDEVQEQVDRLVARVTAARQRDESSTGAAHLVFTGPPGTGKTAVARIIARVYHALGLLPSERIVEASRVDFIGQHLGSTALKTNALIDSALGGVLLIDEAYALLENAGIDGGDNFGREAVATLLKRVEDDRDNLVVILAGYEADMERFLDSNDGLRSRFGRRVSFRSYDAVALQDIAFAMARSRGDALSDDGASVLKAICEAVERTRRVDALGNGRFVRNLLEQTAEFRDVRCLQDATSTPHVTAADLRQSAAAFGIPAGLMSGHSADGVSDTVRPVLDELAAFPGMDNVHAQVRRIVARVQMSQRRGEPISGGAHLLFTGPPGTGKTSVARLVARLYHGLGLLGTDRVLEADRSSMVGDREGSSALKTNRLIDSAIGGVLFIDEAYALVRGTDADGFGHEAVATLLKRMEDDRDQLLVIAAGYEKEMTAFLASNSGLHSRFGRRITFDTYDADTLHEIGTRMSAEAGAHLGAAASDLMREICKSAVDSGAINALGNARFARNLIDLAVEARDVRLFESVQEHDDLSTIQAADLREAASALGVGST